MKALSLASPCAGGVTGSALRFLVAMSTAALVLAAVRFLPSNSARGDVQVAKSEATQAPSAKPRAGSMARHERRLASLVRRLSGLANLVFADADAAETAGDRLADLMIKTHSAETEYLNAKLEHEIAEIAVKEYKHGVAVQDLAVAEGELKLARSDVERWKQEVIEAKQRLARISALADNSAGGLNMIYLYTDKVALAELNEKKAALTLEQAESKKKVLTEYEVVKRTLDLEAAVKKAHSQELAKQAAWQLMKGMEEKARQQSSKRDLPDDRKRILVLIDQAIPLEEKIEARLQEAEKTDTVPQALRDEIDRLTDELEALVDRGESARDAGDFARLKPLIERTARAYKVSGAK